MCTCPAIFKLNVVLRFKMKGHQHNNMQKTDNQTKNTQEQKEDEEDVQEN